MKTQKKLILKAGTTLLMIALFFTNNVQAQSAALSELNVKTSAVCGECKERIETALAFEKGVKKSTLNLKSQIVTITYNPKKTTPEKLRLAITKVGYDADSVSATPKGYNKLPACCKKDVTPH